MSKTKHSVANTDARHERYRRDEQVRKQVRKQEERYEQHVIDKNVKCPLHSGNVQRS